MVRAVAYTRVSLELQAGEDKVSLSEQLADIQAYCTSKGYDLVAHYQDIGSGAFDVVVAWKSDRLSRGIYPASALMEALEGTDVILEAVKDTIDTNNFALLAVVGKMELDNIRIRSRMGQRGKVKEGTMTGTAKYGYTMEGSKGHLQPVVNEDEAAIVRRIFSEYAQGRGSYLIADGLRSEGVPTRRGAPWSASYVWSIVSNPVYVGRGVYGRRRYFKKDNGYKDVRKIKWTSPDSWVPTPYPAIISDAVFQKAQEWRKHWYRPLSKGTHGPDKFLLKGKLWCEHCGRRYSTDMNFHYQKFTTASGETKRYRSREEVRRYVCTSYRHRGIACPRPTIYAKRLEGQVWEELCRFLRDPAPIRAEIKARSKALAKGGVLPALTDANKHLAMIQEKERRAHVAHVNGMFEAEYKATLKQIREARELWEEKAARAKAEADTIPDALAMLEGMEELVKTMQKNLDNAEGELRAATVALWVERVVVAKDSLDIKIRYAQDVTSQAPPMPR
jgi:site-specific DNA recombinase